MRTNREKYNHYLDLIESRARKFIKEQTENIVVPEFYYVVSFSGIISKADIIEIKYFHHKHGMDLSFKGKNPSKKDVERLKHYSELEVEYSRDNIWVMSKYEYNKDNGIISSVSFNNLIDKVQLFHSMEEAQLKADSIDKETKESMAFYELHQKDKNYNYLANGYKFLGWQNSWKMQYFDEDGNPSKESGKPIKYSGYDKDENPEYVKCTNAGHRRVGVSHNSRGSENTVSCPECMIFWKYDCSD